MGVGNDLIPFGGDTFDKGLSIFTPGFAPELYLETETYNLTSGIHLGLGPRYGFAPIPGHQDTEALSSDDLPGLYKAEGSNTTPRCRDRTKVLGIVSIPMQPFGSYTSPATPVYWFILGIENFPHVELNPQPVSKYYPAASSNLLRYQNRIFGASKSGFSKPNYNTFTGYSSTLTIMLPYCRYLMPASSGSISTMSRNLLNTDYDTRALSCAVIVSSSKRIPQKWWAGYATAVSSASDSAPLAFEMTPPLTLTSFILDHPEFVVTKRSNTGTHNLRCYNLATTLNGYQLDSEYLYKSADYSTASVLPGQSDDITVAQFNPVPLTLTTRTTRLDGAAATNTIAVVLCRDDDNYLNSGYKALLIAARRPMAVILQEWRQNGYQVGVLGDASPHQLVDLSRRFPDVPVCVTKNEAATDYTENGIKKDTCWPLWPNYSAGTSLGTSAAAAFNGVIHVRLGAAGSGVLRAWTTYEFTYALYNKTLDFETNVGIPAKIQTGNDDFVAVSLFRDTQNGGGTYLQQAVGGPLCMRSTVGGLTTGLPSATNWHFALNQTEIRIYYRPLGSDTWLPALQIDAAQAFFDPNKQTLWACTTNAMAALPGGTPGGFNDYSPLPDGPYTCVVNYKNRAFWVSAQGLIFSLANNVFCYPGRNATTIPSGSCLGAIVHNYPGQSSQGERLIVFGTKDVYVGRFTGQKLFAPVRVSEDSVGEYPLDGSDFVLDFWTSRTAWSYRAAVIADGFLYWWGPDGIIYDNGVGTPDKISLVLEPDVYDYVDPSETENIHATYNATTKEIIWFYTPKTGDGVHQTYGLVFNTLTRKFYPMRFKGRIDAVYQLNLEDDDATTKVGGRRSIAVVANEDYSNSNIQRAYFFDHYNRSGDLMPGTEMVVKQVSTPSTGTRRLTLAAGYDATNFATIAVGDYIAIQQRQRYAPAFTSDDPMIVQITAKGSGTLDFALPDDATMDNATLAQANYFPIWHGGDLDEDAGLNGIEWNLPTGYWSPQGVDANRFWLFLYFMMRIRAWKGEAPGFDLAYRTPISVGAGDDHIELADNSDGQCQIFHNLIPGDQHLEGQALKMTLSGVHIGWEWVVEYVRAYVTDPDTPDHLLTFQR